MNKWFSICLILVCIFLQSGCLGYPPTVMPVRDFELNRYLGKWYEIARLDHRFERGLEQVSAEYSLRDDGGVKVVNRGFDKNKNQWQQAIGKAYFVESQTSGYLKVSFFGPFYGSYVVFELDRENYQYAFIAGPDESYLWFLSRTPKISDDLLQKFYAIAESKGFNIDELILVRQVDE